MEAFLKAETRKIHLLFAHNDDMAIGAIQAIEEAGLKPGSDIAIVSIDAVKGAFEAMIAGKMNATVECNPLLGPQLMTSVTEVHGGQAHPQAHRGRRADLHHGYGEAAHPVAQVLIATGLMNDGAIVLQARDISRAFPGVQALNGVGLTLRAGEVHALMGQNGAGKSTLIKVLTGVYAPDAGSIELLDRSGERRVIAPESPLHAQELGISAVHQESHLLPNLSVAENICAGRYPRRPWTRGGGIDWRETNRRARELLAGLGIELDVTQLAGGLPAAVQQLAAVARAVAGDARVLILDEPTSSLDAEEVRALFSLMRRLREQGVAILFVTHFLDQVYEICDRITVLRNGGFVGEYACAKLDARGLVAAMVGRELADSAPATHTPAPESVTARARGAQPVAARTTPAREPRDQAPVKSSAWPGC